MGLPWLFAAMNDVSTGGGAAIGGNADVGGDFSGRDRNPVNVYNQFGDREPTHPQRHLSDTDRIDGLEFHMYGQGSFYPGVLRQNKMIIDQQSELVRQNRNMMLMQITLFAVLTILVVVAIANLIIIGRV